jgi:hypothetical protein
MQTRQVLTLAVALAQLCANAATAAEAESASPADAAEDNAVSACPTREAIQESVRVLLSRSQVSADAAVATVDVRDFGDRYVVTLDGRAREYTDQARDCGARARAAAVFVALILTPPVATPPTPNPPVEAERPKPPVAPPPAAKPKSSGFGVGVELGGAGVTAPRHDGSQYVIAGELHLVVAAERWGVGFGGSLPTVSTLDLSGVRVRERRIPLDIAIRRAWGSSWLRTGVELGAVAAIYELRQEAGGKSATRIAPAARVGATLTAQRRGVGVYARIFSEISPVTQPIAVEPAPTGVEPGVVGRTSPLWVGVALGLVAKFH